MSHEHLTVCRPVVLPREYSGGAIEAAVAENPANRAPPMAVSVMGLFAAPQEPLPPEHLAVLVSRYWGPAGVVLPTYFMDGPDAATKSEILKHLNLWHTEGNANCSFVETHDQSTSLVRIDRDPEGGYWSYLGTDCKVIPLSQTTMNLAGITARTDPAELMRVVPHEGGHALGFPHGHALPEVIADLDPAKVIPYYQRETGWSELMIRQQILTPPNASDLAGTLGAADNRVSIMTYPFPAKVTRSGRAIPGGLRPTPQDYATAAKLYPVRSGPVSPPPPPPVPLTVSVGRVALNLLTNGTGITVRYPHVATRDTVSRAALVALLESAGATVH